jgi:hypothetical protein
MSEGINKLRKDYRDIRAPEHLATRIHAEVADRKPPHRSWLPAFAPVAVAVAAVTVAPLLMQRQASDESVPPKATSMSTLTRVSSLKPAVTAPSFSNMKSVKVPALPRKPKPDTEKAPQTYFDMKDENFKEKDHAYS